MAMTVRQLIKELQKWPPNWTVATAFDDNSADEIQWFFNSASELEDGPRKDEHGPTVVLRP
jgi:hypothetical protein